MEEITGITLEAPTQLQATDSNTLGELGTDEFLSLLITQLRTQDPLEPVGNEELLRQIASVREIELSTSLTKSLSRLSDEQRFGSASSLIGKYVTASSDENGVARGGIVQGVRFAAGGQPILQLSDGNEIPMLQVLTVESAQQAAEVLVGQQVVGLDRRTAGEPTLIQGVVQSIRKDESGDVILELDTGEDLRFRDLIQVSPAEAA